MQYSYPARRYWQDIMFFQRLSVYPSVRPSVGYDSSLRGANIPNMSVALNLCFLCNQGSPSQSSSDRRKTCHSPNTVISEHNQLMQLCTARTAWSESDQAVRAVHRCNSR